MYMYMYIVHFFWLLPVFLPTSMLVATPVRCRNKLMPEMLPVERLENCGVLGSSYPKFPKVQHPN